MNRPFSMEALEKKIQELQKALQENAQAGEALRESEKRYRAVVEDLPAMICRFLPDGTLTFVNSFFCAHYTKYKEDLVGHDFFDLFPADTREKVKSHFRALSPQEPMQVYEYRLENPGGPVYWEEWTNRALFDDQGNLVEYQSIGRDITEQKQAQDERARLERQIQQSQKVEAIATLASGIAHDFNNILSAVIGHSELSMLYLPEDSPVRQNIKKILDASHRARDLVHLVQLISLESEPKQKPVQLHRVVKDALKLLRASLPASVELDENITPHSDMVLCDPSQIHQVIINLCTNAGHSIPESGGTLTVLLEPIELDQNAAAAYPELEAGSYFQLTVRDTGRGMDKETLNRIFDPYFTTKEKELGTGLGLAVVRGIVRKYGGSIGVRSKIGRGTAFTVLLPRIAVDALNGSESELEFPANKETILLVDDEQALVDLGHDILENLGYVVECSTDPLNALDVFRTNPQRFDLVITDMTMPQMTGEELAKNLVRIRPNIPIVLCVGFNEVISEENAKKLGVRALEMKPLKAKELAQTVRAVLESKTP
jgi:PAS domain S-box-containing protein